ncbi:MAG TPA: hypothetical protein VIM30_17780 [Candidatus Limnocylindrales bacterium]
MERPLGALRKYGERGGGRSAAGWALRSGTPTPPIGSFPPGLGLRILDLFEDLAHAGTKQGTLLSIQIAVTPSRPLGLARVQILGHVPDDTLGKRGTVGEHD